MTDDMHPDARKFHLKLRDDWDIIGTALVKQFTGRPHWDHRGHAGTDSAHPAYHDVMAFRGGFETGLTQGLFWFCGPHHNEESLLYIATTLSARTKSLEHFIIPTNAAKDPGRIHHPKQVGEHLGFVGGGYISGMVRVATYYNTITPGTEQGFHVALAHAAQFSKFLAGTSLAPVRGVYAACCELASRNLELHYRENKRPEDDVLRAYRTFFSQLQGLYPKEGADFAHRPGS
ncbi:MAG: hypothetical protein Q7S65_04025 [Nanoarchaeota archaeon]|nr:hypothetical protein [Nanoarchaeota archaeon]